MEKEKNLSTHDIVRLFIHTDKMHRSLIEQRMSDLNLHRSQHMMLHCILSFDTPPTQKDIAGKLDISAATVAVTVKKLEQAGFIIKEVNDNDNRCNTISVTQKGKDILSSAKNIFDSVDKNMFSGLSEQELSIFVECLEKIQSNLHSDGAVVPNECKK